MVLQLAAQSLLHPPADQGPELKVQIAVMAFEHSAIKAFFNTIGNAYSSVDPGMLLFAVGLTVLLIPC